MDCKKQEELIPVFMEEELDLKRLDSFLNHIKKCPKCLDELEVQFLVKEGLARLEAGDAFDLQAELSRKIDKSKTVLMIAQRAKVAFIITALVLGIILVGVLLEVFFL